MGAPRPANPAFTVQLPLSTTKASNISSSADSESDILPSARRNAAINDNLCEGEGKDKRKFSTTDNFCFGYSSLHLIVATVEQISIKTIIHFAYVKIPEYNPKMK